MPILNPNFGRLTSALIYWLFYYEHVAKYYINIFLEPIVDEIRKLEEGYNFNIQGYTEIIYGTLTAIGADNLAHHQVDGLKAGFATGYGKCRSSLALAADIQSKFHHRQFTRRFQVDHDEQGENLSLVDLH